MTALKIAQYDADPPAAPTRTAEGNIRVPGNRPAAGAAVDWSAWIELDQAAKILGKSNGHLKRQCHDLARRSLAMRAKGPDDQGQLRWWIKRDYSIKLHDNALGLSSRIPDAFFTELTEDQRSQVLARVSCVKRYRALLTNNRSGPRAQWIGGLLTTLRTDFPEIKMSGRTLYRWHQLYRGEADMLKLADRRGGRRQGPIDPAAWQYFCDLFLNPNQRWMKLCHDLTCDKAQAEGWRWHARSRSGYEKTARLARKRLSWVVRVQARDPERYRNTMSPHMVMDPDAFAPGERWQGDHCVLDLFCLFPGSGGGRVGRPWLTAWFDPKSNKCVGWVLCESPSSETIREALANALRDPSNMGGPDILHIDNGKDYKCEAFHGGKFTKPSVKLKKGYADTPEFHGLFGLLDIKTIFAIPKNSRGKGAIEQWFRYAIHERHDKLWDTYAGKDHDSRPPGLQAKLKDKQSLPTFEEIREAVALRIADHNDSCEHTHEHMVGRSPNQAMLTARRRELADPGVLDFLSLTFSAPVRVHRHAVTIRPLGKALRYSSTKSAFGDLTNTGKLVRVGYRQSDLLGQVYIFDAETMRMICTADHERAGTSTFSEVGREDISAAMKKQRQVKKAAKLLSEESLAATTPTEIIALRESTRRKNAEREAQPATETVAVAGGPTITRLVQTPLDGQSNKLRAATLRRSVGVDTAPGSPQRLELDLSGLAGRLASRKQQVKAAPTTPKPLGLASGLAERLQAKSKGGKR